MGFGLILAGWALFTVQQFFVLLTTILRSIKFRLIKEAKVLFQELSIFRNYNFLPAQMCMIVVHCTKIGIFGHFLALLGHSSPQD